MEEHCIAVIERNAYINPRHGFSAADPALEGSAILPHICRRFNSSFRFFFPVCSKRLVETKSINMTINQLVCKIAAASIPHGKEILFSLQQLPQCC